MRHCTPCCFITLPLLMINFCSKLSFKYYPYPEFNINFLVVPAFPKTPECKIEVASNNNIFCHCAKARHYFS